MKYTLKNQEKSQISLCWAASPQTQRTIFILLQIYVIEAKPFQRTEAQSPQSVKGLWRWEAVKEIKIKSFRVKFKFHWEGEKNLTWEVITEKGLKVEQFRVWQRKAADSGRLKELFSFLCWHTLLVQTSNIYLGTDGLISANSFLIKPKLCYKNSGTPVLIIYADTKQS